MKLVKSLQLTLAILKPHVLANPIALGDIRQIIIQNDFKVVRSARIQLTQVDAGSFYDEHKDKFFYNRLVTFMCSGPLDLYILARENAIREWRKLMGPTKVFQTQFTNPNSIRGKYGLSDTRNATHGSDSVESVRKEIEFFFPEFDMDKWYEEEEPMFRLKGDIAFDQDSFIHTIKNLSADAK